MAAVLAMLRGINVSGQKKIQMADVRTMFEEMRFKQVTTYIQSGNIIFENQHTPLEELPHLIAAQIYARYNFEVPVITRTQAELEILLNQNPWAGNAQIEKEKMLVTFLDQVPAPELVNKLEPTSYEPDKFVVQGKKYSCIAHLVTATPSFLIIF